MRAFSASAAPLARASGEAAARKRSLLKRSFSEAIFQKSASFASVSVSRRDNLTRQAAAWSPSPTVAAWEGCLAAFSTALSRVGMRGRALVRVPLPFSALNRHMK